jgi:hypothetical protein
MDPINRPPAFEAPFTADTGQPWADSYNSVPFDPLNTAGLNKTDGIVGDTIKNIQPPAGTPGPLDADKIRGEVEKIYQTSPPDNLPPQQNTGAAFLESGLHTPPPAPNATPSLQLPTNGTAPPPFPPPPTFPPTPPPAQ